MNGELSNIFIDKITLLLEDAAKEDFGECPVGKSVPKGVVLLLEVERERLRGAAKRNGSFMGMLFRAFRLMQ